MNRYNLKDFNEDQLSQSVDFYEMGGDGIKPKNGTTLEEMLRVCIARLTDLNDRLPCDENRRALFKMESALGWLNLRTKGRKDRGVEGKHEA